MIGMQAYVKRGIERKRIEEAQRAELAKGQTPQNPALARYLRMGRGRRR